MTLTIRLTQDNGNTREVTYTVADGGHALYSRLREIAWAATYGREGDDALSRDASHYTPEA